MLKDSIDQPRPYKLVHQLLCISNINFERQSYIGMVEMHIIAQRSDVRHIKINCKQLRLFTIMMNDYFQCQFTYNDPSLEICQEECKQRNIDSFSASHYTCISSTDPEKNNGEVIIQIPYQLLGSVQEGKVIRINIEFGAEAPLGGVHFAVPRTLEYPDYNVSATHLYTYGHENSSRLWFPSIDSYCEPCTWKLEFTVDASMIAVSSGDLVETVYTHDKKRKTYHYQVTIPTCAPAIGLAVGPFEVMVDPNMHEVTHFALPHLSSLLKDTCAFLHEAFEFYEELLSTRYPYSCYKQVFVDEAYQDCQSYASFSILDVNLLHSKHIIDQTYKTREILTTAIAQQFFGTFITMHSYADAWLTRGISSWLASQYKRKAFGNNEYRFHVYKHLNEVIKYEQEHGGVILDPSKTSDNQHNLYFSPKYLHTVSPRYDAIHKKKSYLIIRILEDRIGRELMLQVFNKLLSLAVNASQQKVAASTLNAWNNMHLSTSSFTKAIFTVTGKDIANFLDQWVYIGGHPKFHGSFIFNRKRNIVELEVKQLETTGLGIRKYMGPITVWIQELDGTFKHNLQVEENTTKHDITCHSKSRRNKKKKIPLCTGEEVDMDLTNMDADSPVLWIRIDPDMQLLRQVVFEQPDINWQYQLRYERDVTAQAEAIEQLKKYPTNQTRKALMDMIENEHCYYKIRCMAAHALTHVANEASATGIPPMIGIFRKLYGSHSCSHIPKLNNFTNFQAYFLQKTLPIAMAGLRTTHKICPPEVLRFIFDLFKYNDNCKNKFSDNFYRAALVEALANTVTPCVTASLARTGSQVTGSDAMSAETKQIVEEIIRYLNLDKLLPCYRHTVTVACLKAIRHLQKMGHLPSNSLFYKEYAQYGVFVDLRLAAIDCLIDITKAEQRKEDLEFLLDIIEADPAPRVRFMTIKMMIDNPPITRKDIGNILNSEEVVERLWKLMNNCMSHDSKLRCAMVDLYYTFYGRNRPSCLPKPEFSMVFNLKEKKAVINTTSLNYRRSQNTELSPVLAPTSAPGLASAPTSRKEWSEMANPQEAYNVLSSLARAANEDPPAKVRRLSPVDQEPDQERDENNGIDDDKIHERIILHPSPFHDEQSPSRKESFPLTSNERNPVPGLTFTSLEPLPSAVRDFPTSSVDGQLKSEDTSREMIGKEPVAGQSFIEGQTSESSKKHKKKKKKHKLHKEHKHKHKHKDKDKDKEKKKSSN